MEITTQTVPIVSSINENQVSKTENESIKVDNAEAATKDTNNKQSNTQQNEDISKIADAEKDSKVVNKVAQQLQNFVSSINKDLKFSVDEDSGRDVISVIDNESGDLIRQIPSEEILDLASRISEAAGILIKKEV